MRSFCPGRSPQITVVRAKSARASVLISTRPGTSTSWSIPAAIIKALQKGDAWLADRVYSGVPAAAFGRHQEIAIGFMSGASNVGYWLKQHGVKIIYGPGRHPERAHGLDPIPSDPGYRGHRLSTFRCRSAEEYLAALKRGQVNCFEP